MLGNGNRTWLGHIFAHMIRREERFGIDYLSNVYKTALFKMKAVEIDPTTGEMVQPIYMHPTEYATVYPTRGTTEFQIQRWCYIFDHLLHDAAVSYTFAAAAEGDRKLADIYAALACELFDWSAELRKGVAIEAFRLRIEDAFE